MSIPRFDVNLPLKRVRKCIVNDDRTVTIQDVQEPFRGRIYENNAKHTHPLRDTSMRTSLYEAHDILWCKPGQAVGDDLQPGDRISDGSDIFEALSGIRDKRAGTTTLVKEVWVTRVDSLYPILAQLTELGGVAVTNGDVPCFVWEESETDNSRGTYRRLTMEAPVEWFLPLSVTNRELTLANKVHHIDQVTLHLGQPHVTATLRAKT